MSEREAFPTLAQIQYHNILYSEMYVPLFSSTGTQHDLPHHSLFIHFFPYSNTQEVGLANGSSDWWGLLIFLAVT